jgi:hypothetical protein
MQGMLLAARSACAARQGVGKHERGEVNVLATWIAALAQQERHKPCALVKQSTGGRHEHLGLDAIVCAGIRGRRRQLICAPVWGFSPICAF